MKNSAWYHKLWRKKLDEHPLKENADTSWVEMQALLEQHLPANDEPRNNKPTKFFGSTVVSMLGFILPAAAMIGAITFVAVKHPFRNKPVNKHSHGLIIKRSFKDSSKTDSLLVSEISDSAKIDSAAIVNKPKENIAAAISAKANNIKTPTNPTAVFAVKNNKVKLSGNIAYINGSPQSSLITNHQNKVSGATTDAAVAGQDNSNARHQPGLTDKNGVADSAKQQGNIAANSTTVLNKTKDGSSAMVAKPAPDQSNRSGLKKNNKNKLFANDKTKGQNWGSEEPLYNYSLDAGLNTSKYGKNVVLGLMTTYALNNKWLLNTGIRLDLNRSLSGGFTYPANNEIIPRNNQPDSSSSFKITDSRKITVLSVPVNLEYKISNIISINAGPQISFSVNQTKVTTKAGTITSYRDTLGNTHNVDSALKINAINKINFGVSGGISIHLHQFYIDGSYLQNITPYKITTGLGGYQQYYRSFQVGLRYKFKKKRN